MEKKARVRFAGRIPRPTPEVFDAIVDETKLSHYFVSRASGPLEAGRTATWYFDDVGAEVHLLVLSVEKNKRILFQWAASGKKADVSIELRAVGEGTEVRIEESSWPLDETGVLQALGQMSGWTDFFISLKAYLLFGIDLRRGVLAPEESGAREAAEKIEDFADLIPESKSDETQNGSPTTPTRTIAWTIGGLTFGIALGAGGMYLAQPNMCVAPAVSNLPSSSATTTSRAPSTNAPSSSSNAVKPAKATSSPASQTGLSI